MVPLSASPVTYVSATERTGTPGCEAARFPISAIDDPALPELASARADETDATSSIGPATRHFFRPIVTVTVPRTGDLVCLPTSELVHGWR